MAESEPSTLHQFFGWNLLFSSIKNDIKTNSDVVIALVHWYLIRNSFLCIGIGDDKTLGENENGSETLPDEWNVNDRTYKLRYINNKKLYILMGVQTDNNLILNLLDPHNRNVSNLCIDVNETVKTCRDSIDKMVPTVQSLLERIKRELIEPVFPKNTKDSGTQTQRNQQEQAEPRQGHVAVGVDPIFPNLIGPYHNDPLRNFGRDDLNPLRDLGRDDLNPLGGSGGGGMLLPFPRRGGFDVNPNRPNIRPPGARFDPFGPPDNSFLDFDPDNPNRQVNRQPNPDHLRPGSNFDDMYS